MEKSRRITSELRDAGSRLPVLLLCFIFCYPATLAQNRQKSGDARATVQTFFSLLKSQRYASLYEYLPSKLQEQITREQLTTSLKRLETYITIERMEIGRVQQNGDYAVIDTTIYGRLKKPLKHQTKMAREGRITVQQYLFKEDNRWKVVTADNRARDYFLKRNPEFNKQFQFNLPRFEIKQEGEWR
ncbi:MAG: hypothetical protein L0220_04820, partial [Acidobacteria bacterium]|nr:hypothetical protein [Acidobacteriota bacterium]